MTEEIRRQLFCILAKVQVPREQEEGGILEIIYLTVNFSTASKKGKRKKENNTHFLEDIYYSTREPLPPSKINKQRKELYKKKKRKGHSWQRSYARILFAKWTIEP